MKILFITDFFYPHVGGVEKLFTSLTTQLVEKGSKVTYITWLYDKSLPKHETYKGITIIRISSPSRMLFPFFALPVLIREAKKNDFIHTSTYSSAIGAWIAAKLSNTKAIVTVHEVWDDLWKQLPFLSKFEAALFHFLEKIMLKMRFNTYIAVSKSTKNALLKQNIPEKKIELIYNGLDYSFPKWERPDLPFTFTFFGRAGVSKGIDLLLSAAIKMLEIHPEVKFKFIVSPQHPKVYKYIKENISRRLNSKSALFLSNLSKEDLISELLSSHCIIIPSACEGFGFTAAEASAMGIPIISSGKGSLPEVVSGKVIEMEDYSTKDLFKAMEAAINSEFIDVERKEFTIDSFVSKHLTLYNSLNSI